MPINIVTQRFLKCCSKLIEQNVVRSSRHLALSLDYLPQSFSEIKKERRDAPVELMVKAVELYGMNPAYLFKGEGELFAKGDQSNDFRVLTVVTDPRNDERIVHVPVSALAGYAQEATNPGFMFNLPTYTLPDTKYQSGTYRSFDIEGDSMEPSLFDGDKIVCSYLEPAHWERGLKENHVYVLITRSDVVVKRVINQLADKKQLLLLSDNPFYQPYAVHVTDIREIWFVRTKISPFLHSIPQSQNRLEDIIAEQTKLITTLKATLDRLMLGR